MRKAIVWNFFRNSPNTPYRNIPLVSGERPTQEELKKIVVYNDRTGQLHWKYRTKETFASPMAMQTFSKRFAGKVACTRMIDNTPALILSGKEYRIKNLVWLYHYGSWPTARVYHIDGDTTNTRIENLAISY